MFRAMTPRTRLVLLSSVSAVLLTFLSAAGWAAQSLGTDLTGHAIYQLAPANSRAVVMFFTASDCPIANRYVPEIQRLDREFAPEAVRFWWVYPNPEDTAAVVRSHRKQFGIDAPVVLDTEQRLTHMAHATVTPEVALFVPAGANLREVYRGRIDDRYVALGRERPAATKHDLELAIRAVLNHRPVPGPDGPAVGCSIVPRSDP